MNFEILKSNSGKILKGAFLMKPQIFKDRRGFFMESWNKKVFDKIIGENILFVQDNQSSSTEGVLRGMHYQLPPMAQGKLVRCISGKIFDVIIDIRISSDSFKEWAGVYLDSDKNEQLWVPSGFAHGFLTISNTANVVYKTTNFWSKEHENSIHWNDPSINIEWPKTVKNIYVSDKDNKAEIFSKKTPNQFFK